MPKRKKKRSGFLSKELPQPRHALIPRPEFSHFSSQNKYRDENPIRQQPSLNHELAVENKDYKGLRLNLLHATQHPLNHMPPALKKKVELILSLNRSTPSMTNYSNLDAPTPTKPKGRPV
jgi:hypothetical protein